MSIVDVLPLPAGVDQMVADCFTICDFCRHEICTDPEEVWYDNSYYDVQICDSCYKLERSNSYYENEIWQNIARWDQEHEIFMLMMTGV